MELNEKYFIQVDYVETALDAVDKLVNNKKYHLVCLDHDLCEEHYTGKPTDTKSGKFVANSICKMSEKAQPNTIVLHSMNDYARQDMQGIIVQDSNIHLYIFPFSVTKYTEVLINELLLFNA